MSGNVVLIRFERLLEKLTTEDGFAAMHVRRAFKCAKPARRNACGAGSLKACITFGTLAL